ncbi:EamA-like transporter family protein [Paracoccus sp. M683]|uniref:DMT family transporter n=1 Tax=Paracoccus sp. M683 TaxID=2594268 RepID=UPI00117E479A|nr:DMT family transporter [Paracoccus sp. M683]TRW98728.1 EamA-like transporter family protein [Paracoccus sp. M683]
MTVFLFFILVAAGAALVVQNIIMMQMSVRASTILIVLLMNSAVGLVLLSALLIARTGFGGIRELVSGFQPWAILPGLLGTFFVFASLLGYQRVGAAATVSILVASQLLLGLTVDLARTGSPSPVTHLPSLVGAALLVLGAYLVVSRSI